MTEDINNNISPPGVTFTPCGEEEPYKECTNCDKIQASTKYGFKYESRDGVKGKLRNSSCLNCRKGIFNVKKETFEQKVDSKLEALEVLTQKLDEDLEEEKSKNERLQLVIMSLSGSIEELKVMVKLGVHK